MHCVWQCDACMFGAPWGRGASVSISVYTTAHRVPCVTAPIWSAHYPHPLVPAHASELGGQLLVGGHRKSLHRYNAGLPHGVLQECSQIKGLVHRCIMQINGCCCSRDSCNCIWLARKKWPGQKMNLLWCPAHARLGRVRLAQRPQAPSSSQISWDGAIRASLVGRLLDSFATTGTGHDA